MRIVVLRTNNEENVKINDLIIKNNNNNYILIIIRLSPRALNLLLIFLSQFAITRSLVQSLGVSLIAHRPFPLHPVVVAIQYWKSFKHSFSSSLTTQVYYYIARIIYNIGNKKLTNSHVNFFTNLLMKNNSIKKSSKAFATTLRFRRGHKTNFFFFLNFSSFSIISRFLLPLCLIFEKEKSTSFKLKDGKTHRFLLFFCFCDDKMAF